jgi:DNA replication protein DnaC
MTLPTPRYSIRSSSSPTGVCLTSSWRSLFTSLNKRRVTALELPDRGRRATERCMRQAKFPVVKSLDSFDFLAIPSLNKTLVLELARCEFLARKENLLLLGNCGTGRTHIALALGLATCERGHRVRFGEESAAMYSGPENICGPYR